MSAPPLLSDRQAFVDQERLVDREWYTFLQKLLALATGADFDSGTGVLFRQSAAPTGWTKITTNVNDRTLRVVSDNIVDGGSVAFSTVFAQAVTGSHTLTSAEIPSHGHTVNDPTHLHTSARYSGAAYTGVDVGATGSTGAGFVTAPEQNTELTATSISLNNTGGGGGHDHTMDMRVQFLDVIIATRDAH